MPEPSRNLPEDPTRWAKVTRVIEMRLAAVPLRVISAETGVAIATINKWISKYTREFVPVDDLDAIRAKESDMLDRMEQAALGLMAGMNERNKMAALEYPYAMPYGPDDMMKVTDRVLKIQDRRARLLGLDSATKVEATVKVTSVDPEVEALVAELLGGGKLISKAEDIDRIA